MSTSPSDLTRRAFLTDALKLGTATVALGATLLRADAESNPSSASPTWRTPLAGGLTSVPQSVFVETDGTGPTRAQRSGSRFTRDHVAVDLKETTSGVAVSVNASHGPISRVVLRWEASFPAESLFLGDHWERGYGDLQWRHVQPERIMPWYFAAHHAPTGRTFMAGVRVQPSALCFWTVDASGFSLWLDFRNGGSPSLPGDREIPAATVVSLSTTSDETPFSAITRFCRVLCPQPRLPTAPICGNNNWYYAYGRNFDADAMRRDAAFLASLAEGHPNRPYCVIDAGWTPGSVCPGGPWLEGDPKRFPDMPGLAEEMRLLGVKPGIWMRPTALMKVDDPSRLRNGPVTSEEKPLDLSLPQNLALIHEDVVRVRSWGYDLIKHDFSTYDIFGKWGFQMGAALTEPGWHFADQTLTNAEIILGLYRTLRAAAADAVLIGCNTMGHLGAGLFEVQRAGDDTSGHVWERTRRMGVNTLAYRLPQNGAFFTCDPDCAAHTERTPWEFDRQFLDLVARSGTSLFVSADPRTVTAEQKASFSSAMQLALSGGTAGGCEPLDWLYTTAPREWRIGSEKVTYHWEEAQGANPLRV